MAFDHFDATARDYLSATDGSGIISGLFGAAVNGSTEAIEWGFAGAGVGTLGLEVPIVGEITVAGGAAIGATAGFIHGAYNGFVTGY
ncbi:hypothetical protein ACVRWB_05515 [Streptococcus troglodytae]|uniref:Uncharacterized protein n=1 Tax=Streptococcus troglodytae TaxID=1111760 RepID=A0A1L7LLP5_9STRE|nr:hypothetical protein [Streptococcus troglodytae]BAQ25101.1 uncharacterized protein SRT_18400 [Streptococcus troglodytae]